MAKVKGIRWADSLELECGESWNDDFKGTPHSCVKDRLHVIDSTDNDHQCCCGVQHD